MKSALLIFAILVAVLIFLGLKTDIAHVKLEGDSLVFYDKKCKKILPVKRVESFVDQVDVINIDRILLELGDHRFYYERVSLPPKNDFGMPYGEIIEGIFGFKRSENIFESDGAVIYRGDFDVALFYDRGGDLTLIYPLNDRLIKSITGCFGKTINVAKDTDTLKKSDWNVKLIILGNMVTKDI